MSSEFLLPLAIEFLLLLGVTILWIGKGPKGDQASWLFRLVIVAVAVRMVAMLAIHLFFSPYTLAPDAETFEYFGRTFRDFLEGESSTPGSVFQRWQLGYYVLNGLFFWMIGETPFGPVIFNIFASVWTAVLAFFLGRRVFNENVGRWAAVLTAFFPSSILWSVLNVREAPSGFFVLTAVWLGVHMVNRFSLRSLISIFAVLAVLSTLRDYMGALVTAGIILGWITATRTERAPVALFSGTTLIMAGSFLASRFGIFGRFALETPLTTAAGLRASFATGAGSAFGQGADITSVGSALVFLPIGVSHFLFAPFPWSIEGLLQTAALPETLVWYMLIPFVIRGMGWGFANCLRRGAAVLFGVILVITLSYSLVEGNVGTAFRHRAQVMPMFFIFAGVGIELYRARRAHRRQARVDPKYAPSGTR